MVLPKSIREKACIAAGDRLALITWAKEDRVCCISLIKVEELSEMVGGFLSSLTTANPSGS
jgi:bifunctional DNA-binding transcriptional regulator/antitoxin component of YhaV-PrlF toxin-antitoxin module